MKRFFSALFALLLLCTAFPAFAATPAASPTPPPREIETEIIQEIPEEIQKVLDIAYEDWQTVDGKKQKNPNKYTKWRNNGQFGWCGGFITWCWFVKHRLHFIPVAGSRQRVEIFPAIRMPEKYYPTLTRHQVICSCKAGRGRP